MNSRHRIGRLLRGRLGSAHGLVGSSQTQPSDRSATNESGFTLLEVVVSFTLLVIVAAAVVAAIINGTRATNASQQKVAAANIARQYMESARALGNQVTPTYNPVLVSGTNFSVCRDVARVDLPISPPTNATCITNATNGCSSSSAGKQFYVSIRVTWPAQVGSGSLKWDTVLSC